MGSSSSPAPAVADGAETADANRPAPAEAIIEVDEESTNPSVSEDDEGYSDSDARTNATTSLSSSVRDYTFENSRRYHKFQEGKYHFPNDEPEQEREDMRHCMMVHVGGGALHYAPLKNPQKVLDIGTGTGIWAIDSKFSVHSSQSLVFLFLFFLSCMLSNQKVGDEYPEAEVIGIDLSPIQPSWVPTNVRFIVDDAEQPWVGEPNSYDHIHIRGMAPAIKNWPNLMAEAFTYVIVCKYPS